MKKQLFVALLISLSFIPQISAQCVETDENKVLLVGDSWAFFMGADETFNTIFEKWGHSNAQFYTNATLSENGAETIDFMQADKQNEIAAQLDAQPEIEVVHLSLGGNDVLGEWNVSFTEAETDSLIDLVFNRLISIVDFIKDARPGIRIVWSGYAYPNFGQVLEDAGALQTIHPFYDTWEGMGFPTFLQLNALLNEVSSMVTAYAVLDPQIDFVNATGLMQYTFGQATALSVPPGGSYPPFQAPLPIGYPDYPSPKTSMRNYGVFLDCFHLSALGYRDFIDYQTQKFYQKFLMGDQYLIAESGTAEGSVSAGGLTENNVLKLGHSSGDEMRPIITFNTTSLPDAGISSASVFLRRESLVGANPLSSGLQVKINNPHFGSGTEIDSGDFSATANATVSPCFFGSPDNNGDWIRIELPTSVLGLFDNTSTVQLMLVAPGNPDGVITFTNADDPDFAPVLSVNHNFITSSPPEVLHSQIRDVVIYPNPTTGRITVQSTTDIMEIQLFNHQGQLLKTYGSHTSIINLEDQSAGMYLIKVLCANQVSVNRVIRN